MTKPTVELHVKLGMTIFDTVFNRCKIAHAKDIVVQACLDDRIETVRERALSCLSVSVAHGDLHFQGHPLDAKQTVAEAGLSNEDRLYLFYSIPRGWE